MRSNHRVLLAGRRATLAITVAALGLGVGSSLAEASDDVPTTDPVTAEEGLVVELVIEAPAIDAPVIDAPVSEEPTTTEPTLPPVADPGTSVAVESTVPAALDESPSATTTEATDDEGGHDEGTGGEGGHDEGGHDEGTGGEGGHDGGKGEGNPYRMTFSVEWRSDDGTPIAVLEGALPDGWRTLFELTAASRTGKNQPTSARCTYAESGDQLVCEFDNPGHRSEAEGMIVPARPTATYSVTVVWDTVDWTIDGANAGPYSARQLCPRGGGGGHDSGHEHLTEAAPEEPGGQSVVCNHTIVIQRVAVVVPEPEEPTDPTPPTVPTQAALPPTAATATSTQRTLPATGTPTSVMLAMGIALAAIGGGLALVARRAASDPIGVPVDDRGRMPT
jgi:LPXTG-motif cell wall-anchored protein